MREIKFRAWDDDIDAYHNNPSVRVTDINGGIEEYQRVMNWVFEQFTGLKDKNGVDIYEGDIVHDADGGYDSEVVFGDIGYDGSLNGLTGFALKRWNCDGFYELDYYFTRSTLEVIGNIHENPELLDGK